MRYIAGGAQIVDIIAGSTALWRKSGAQQKKGANHKTIFINKVKVIKFEMNVKAAAVSANKSSRRHRTPPGQTASNFGSTGTRKRGAQQRRPCRRLPAGELERR